MIRKKKSLRCKERKKQISSRCEAQYKEQIDGIYYLPLVNEYGKGILLLQHFDFKRNVAVFDKVLVHPYSRSAKHCFSHFLTLPMMDRILPELGLDTANKPIEIDDVWNDKIQVRFHYSLAPKFIVSRSSDKGRFYLYDLENRANDSVLRKDKHSRLIQSFFTYNRIYRNVERIEYDKKEIHINTIINIVYISGSIVWVAFANIIRLYVIPMKESDSYIVHYSNGEVERVTCSSARCSI